jgi:tRNA U34 2-thiouridine synthase MnmA/TrmU
MKAIALVSGGLDSTLAAKLIKDQGVEVVGLNFKTPFCLCDRGKSSGCASYSRKFSEDFGMEFKIFSLGEDFFKIIENPKHGYGSNLNPCIDCRIMKFRKAKEFMQETGASFIITGEVIGQRPMSQHRQAFSIIDKESGLEGLVLRPLSAQLLEETLPEKEGWVEREKLLSFNGRARKPQMDLAEEFNIKDYPCPAGGCLLTDPEFSKKVKDLVRHGELSLNNIELLKAGRYFRFSKEAKLIVGRNERENERLENLAQEGDIIFSPPEIAGPTALGRGQFNEELIKFSAEIVCRYSDLNGKHEAAIAYKKAGRVPFGESPCLIISPADDIRLSAIRIG